MKQIMTDVNKDSYEEYTCNYQRKASITAVNQLNDQRH